MIVRIVRKLQRMLRPDEFTSLALRKKMREQYQIEVGLYSYGCFDPERIGRMTRFGRYCSIAPTAHVFRRNHGVNFLGLTPYFYNANLQVVEVDKIPYEPLEISDDVWLGHNSVVLPSVKRIGRGAVIAAGAVVTVDVEPYSIVGGNPAKLIRKRFDEETIDKIEQSEWWKLSPSEIRREIRHRPEFFFEPANYLHAQEF